MAKLTTLLLEKSQTTSDQFNLVSLFDYCRSHVHGFPSCAHPSRFSVRQFGHGQSNPTFLLELSLGGSEKKRYVLRKKPHGKLLPSAHAVEREYQVLHVLGNHTTVPVPKVFCLCTDMSVIGTAFYIMEFLEGRIFFDPTLPDVAPLHRNAIYSEVARVLASLHLCDVDAIGLTKFGRRDSYCKRQVDRWAKQYMALTGEGKLARNPKMLELVSWLQQHIPVEDSSKTVTGLVHGDFRIDNLVFHPIEDRVIGILDWELSTLGNQMCDVAYSCLHYFVNFNLDEGQDAGLNQVGIPEGMPSVAVYLAEYCHAARKPWPAADWKFYVAFSLFRGAAIYAGVYSRYIKGNASGGMRAEKAGSKANVLIDSALSFIKQHDVLPDKSPSESLKFLHHSSDAQKDQNLVKERGKNIPSERIMELRNRLIKFMENHIYPRENELYKLAMSSSSSRWTIHPEEEKLKEMAKREGLWNLWIPSDSADRARKILFDGKVGPGAGGDYLLGAGLSNLEYGYLCEIMGRSLWAPQVFNCGAPDTGNMEVLLRYGSKQQLQEWLVPLLEGKIRSGFAMTEPKVASSDATNIECSIRREGDSYIINGTKWWTSGAMDPRCKILIVMGKTDFNAPKHKQQSMILVDMETPGITIKRPLTVFGYDDAPHGHAEIAFIDVRTPAKNILLGEGRGFEIAQGRLGPGRLHHCMRLIGAAERGMQLMAERALQRTVFGKLIAQHGSFQSDIAKCRIELEKTRLLVLEAADQLDRLGNKKARGIIAMAKVAAPSMALQVLDKAMQVHGAAGLSSDTVLAHLWATARTLRIADGPDEVHLGTIAKLELQRSRL